MKWKNRPTSSNVEDFILYLNECLAITEEAVDKLLPQNIDISWTKTDNTERNNNVSDNRGGGVSDNKGVPGSHHGFNLRRTKGSLCLTDGESINELDNSGEDCYEHELDEELEAIDGEINSEEEHEGRL